MRKYFTDNNGDTVYAARCIHNPNVRIGGYSGPLSFDYDFSPEEARKLGEWLIAAADEIEKEVSDE